MSHCSLHRSLLRTSALATTIWLGLSVVAAAETSSLAFDIPQQPLARSLQVFSKISGQPIIFSDDLVTGKEAPSLRGSYTLESALEHLLAGSALTVERSPAGAIMIRAERKESSAQGVVRIAAQAAAPVSAPASTTNPVAPSGPAEVEEIVVTGSRIVRDGYEAPTPVTVVTSDAIAAGNTTSNVALYINTLPVFANSTQAQASVGSYSSGQAGFNALNLRNLGVARTLVLLDGQRVVSTSITGAVDINTFPQQLISRVDVVTGGASAVYGSDAVAGVVNFVLDHDFTGFKGEISGGISDRADAENFKVLASGGASFGDDRGHVLLSAELSHQAGIMGAGGRSWDNVGAYQVTNPNYSATNGQPQYLNAVGAGLGNSTRGGLIPSGPLKGTAFGPGGVPYQKNYGSIYSGTFMIGGDWRNDQIRDFGVLQPEETRKNVFARVSYDLSDNVNVFVQALWSDSNVNHSAGAIDMLEGLGITIRSDNAYLPASVRARMTALGVTSFTLSTMAEDLSPAWNEFNTTLRRYAAGFSGSFDALGTEWDWNASYLFNYISASRHGENNFLVARMREATDAVFNAEGNIICRSALTNPNNGCSPLNLMGIGVASGAGKAYVLQTSFVRLRPQQQVWDASITGEPFSTWAGPVSVAFNFAHRREEVTSIGNTQGNPWWGNFGMLNGADNVTEGAAETVIPLAKDVAWAEAWDLSAAIRATDYASSGYVTTWKVGSTFAPTSDFRLRGTLSRDIRAGTINELFLQSAQNRPTISDPFISQAYTVFQENSGNPNLRPERATSKAIGAVYQPAFVPGLSMSVDYWSVSVKDAVTNVSGQIAINQCYLGQTEFCSSLYPRVNGILDRVKSTFFNYARTVTRGIDAEASYQTSLDPVPGDLSLRGQITAYLENMTNSGFSPPVDSAGSVLTPDWRLTTSATYELDQLRATLTYRAFPKMLVVPGAIQCASGCPTSTPASPTYDRAWTPGAGYLDTSLSYRFTAPGDASAEAFLNVRNVLNRQPPPFPVTAYYTLDILPGVYDYLGMVFRAGVRFQM